MCRRAPECLALGLAVAMVSGTLAAPPGAVSAPKKPRIAVETGQNRTSVARNAAPPPVLKTLEIWPKELTLGGVRPERQLIVTGTFSDGEQRDLTDRARYWASARQQFQVAPGGLVTAVAPGAGIVKVAVGAVSTQATVKVEEIKGDAPVRFKVDVEPVLNRAGCNQGACHAAMAGKGGFRLSLLGFDADADYAAIATDAARRRINRAFPEQSLFLLKPMMEVPHAGGLRLKAGTHDYQVLADWLAAGTPGPKAEEPEVTRIEVYPAERLVRLPTGEKPLIPVAYTPSTGKKLFVDRLAPRQRISVLAHFTDGTVEDVTRRAQFNSLNEGVAAVDSGGRIEVAARGQAGVMVRYMGKAAVVNMVVPYFDLPANAPPSLASNSYVDQLVMAKWRQMGLKPSARSTDAEYLRRVYLDVLGILPTPEEVRAFIASADPEKRRKLVEQVLQRPEYADYWTLKWGDLLRNHRDKLGEKGMWSFHNWLRTVFRDNWPMDRFAKELITAQGSTFTNGPANFFRVASNPADLAETTSQVLLGVRLACAKCHHHPFEKWSQDDYWQMAAFFARVGNKGSQEFGIFGGEQVVRLNPGGEVSNPRTGKRMQPTPLDGKPAEDPIDRRRPLAEWVASPDNAFFARNIVNRYWSYLMGRGLVDPVDDLRVTNPASNPQLLDALAKDFVEHRFDVKHLLRTILTSEVYQLSSEPTPENRQDEVFHTHYLVKRLGAEQLLDAVNFATDTQEKFPNLPLGYRATQLPDPGVQSYFLEVFGRPERAIACECERSPDPNMAQALHLMNSDFVQNKVANGSGRLAQFLNAKKTDDEIVDELYLATFSRSPKPAELEKAKALVAGAPSKKEGFEDLLWALINAREFLFVH